MRDYEAPLLGELLQAALDEAHLKVRYDSIGSGVTERVIFPYGLYVSRRGTGTAPASTEEGRPTSL